MAARGREFQADFQTGKETHVGTSTERRPDAISLDHLRAWSIGPVQRSDPSEGLLRRVWRVRVDNATGDVWLRRANANVNEPQSGWRPESLLFSFTGAPIDEVDLAFDQNGNAIVCAERAGRVWLYWFSPQIGAFTFQDLCPGLSPRVLLDDPESSQDSDVLLFYALTGGTSFEMRQQRDLYLTVYPVPIIGEHLRLEEVARDNGFRLQLIYSRRDIASGTYALHILESAPYPIRMHDALWVDQYVLSAFTESAILAVEQINSMNVYQSVISAVVSNLLEIYTTTPDPMLCLQAVTGGLTSTVLIITAAENSMSVTQSVTGGLTTVVVLTTPNPMDSMSVSQSILSAVTETV